MEEAALSLWYDEVAGDVTLAFRKPDASYEQLCVRELPLDSERDETLPSSGMIVDAFKAVTEKLAFKNNFSPANEMTIHHVLDCMGQAGFDMVERFSELTESPFKSRDQDFRNQREELEKAMTSAKAANDQIQFNEMSRKLDKLNVRAVLSHMALHRLRHFRENQQQSWSELLGIEIDLTSRMTRFTEQYVNYRSWQDIDIKEKNRRLRRILEREEKEYKEWFKDEHWHILRTVPLPDLLRAAEDPVLTSEQAESRIAMLGKQMSDLLPGHATEKCQDSEAQRLVTVQDAVLDLIDRVASTPWKDSAMEFVPEQSRSLWRSVTMRWAELMHRRRLPRISSLTFNPFRLGGAVEDAGVRVEGDAVTKTTLQATDAAGSSSTQQAAHRGSKSVTRKRKTRAKKQGASRYSEIGPTEGAPGQPALCRINTELHNGSDAEADGQAWHDLPNTENQPVDGGESTAGDSVSTLWFTPPSGSMILDPETEGEPMDETRTPRESGPIPSSAPRERSSDKQPTPPTHEVQLNDIHALGVLSEGPLEESGRELNLPLSPLERSAPVSADDHLGYRSDSDRASTADGVRHAPGNGLDTACASGPDDWRAPAEDAQSRTDGNQHNFIGTIHDADVESEKQSVDPNTVILLQLLGSENQLQHTPRARRRNSAEALPGKGVCHTRYDLLTELSLEKALESKPASLKYGWSDTPLSVKACLEGWRDDASDEEETMSTKSEAV